MYEKIRNFNFKNMENIIDKFKKLENYDYGTAKHCFRMMDRAAKIYQYSGLPNDIQEDVLIGILLHDIGKLLVPKEIINKPGPLNDEEWKIMKKHPINGKELLKEYPIIVQNICLLHHVKIDKKGYPDYPDLIPDYVQFATVLDIFDAISHKRSYKSAFYDGEVFEELEKEARDTKINPFYVNLLKNQFFMQAMEDY